MSLAPNARLGDRLSLLCVIFAAFGVLAFAMLPARAAGDTTATWQSETSGDWTNALLWSTNPSYPNNGTPTGVNYQAWINATGGTAYTVTLDSDVAVDALTLDSPDVTLQHSAGTLTASTLNVNAGSYLLEGGTIAGAAINIGPSGQFQVDNYGTLNGVSIAGGDVQVSDDSELFVQNGLTMANHNLDLGQYNSVYFDGSSQSIDNLNIIPSTYDYIYASGPTSNGPQTLTLGPHTTVHGGAWFFSYNSGDTLINNGTINGDNYYGLLILLDNFTNNNLAEATNGGTLYIGYPNYYPTNWNNSASGTIKADGGAVSLNGAWTNNGTISAVNSGVISLDGSWNNAGTISATGGSTINLGGTFNTAQLGSLSASADSTVNITGTLDNTSSTLNLTGYGGTWNLQGGTISNGTLDVNASDLHLVNGTLSGVTVSGGPLQIQGGSIILDSVTVTGGDLQVNNGSVTIQKGLTLSSPSVDLSNSSSLDWNGGSGTACSLNINSSASTVSFDGSWSNTGTLSAINGSTVNLGGSFAAAGIGSLNISADSTVNLTGTLDNTSNSLKTAAFGGTWCLQGGTITNGILDVSGSNFSVQNGTLNGVTIGGGTVSVNGSTLNLGGSWSNAGTISAINGSTLNLGGNFTTAGMGSLGASADSTVNLMGTLDNTSSTLNLAGYGGTWNLQGGTISNGILDVSGSNFNVQNGTLSGVTVSGGPLTVVEWGAIVLDSVTLNGVDLQVNDGSVFIENKLTAAGGASIDLGGSNGRSNLTIDGPSQTIDNLTINGIPGGLGYLSNVIFNDAGPSGLVTLTLGSHALVQGALNIGSGNYIGSTLINNGTINADAGGWTLSINPDNFTNNGTAEATNGGTLAINSLNCSNAAGATLQATGGSTLNLGGTWTNAAGGTISVDGSTLNAGGVWTNQGTISATNMSKVNLGGSFATASLSGYSPDATTTTNLIGTLDNSGATFHPGSYAGSWYLQGGTIAGGTLDVSGGNFNVKNGTLDSVTVSGGVLSLNGATLNLIGAWNAAGISATNQSTVNLGGNFTTAGLTAALSGYSPDATTTTSLIGTLDNSGATFHLGSYAGTWSVKNGGTITGGTVDASGGNFNVQNGTFNDVTVSGGDLQVGQKLCVQNGLTVSDHNVNLASLSSLVFDGPSQTIDNLNIVVGGNYWANIYASGASSTGAQTLTLGPNVTVHGGAQFNNYHSGDTLINNGTINADKLSTDRNSSAVKIILDNFTNNAIAEATNGEILFISSPQWSNAVGGTLSANGATLNLGGSWTNAGTISATNAATVNLGGTFNTAQIASLSASADSTVTITGSLDNGGATLQPGTSGGMWSLTNGGTITGGTIDASGGNFTVQNGTLNGVSVSGGDLRVSRTLCVQNGLTVSDQNVDLTSSSGELVFDGPSQAIDNLNIVTAGFSWMNIYASGPSSNGPQTLTLGPKVTVHGGAQFNNYHAGDALINNGTINADASATANTKITATKIILDSFTNNGTAEATNGGTLYIGSASFTNNGTLAVHNGGQIMTASGLNVGAGTLTGSGAIYGNVTLASDPSTLAFNIGGETQGTEYDSLSINGNMTLAGNLQITITNGFVPLGTDAFTVLQGAAGDTLSGSFLNVADGGRLETADGSGSFEVSYGSGAYANQIVLGDFVDGGLPEPASAVLLVGGCALGALRRPRRVKA